MKKFISAILMFMLLFSMVTSVSAAELKSKKVNQNEVGVTTKVVELTEDQYVEVVSKHSGLSVDQVKSKLNAYKENIAKNSTFAGTNIVTPQSEGIQYRQAITTKNFSPNSIFSTPVELGMAYTVYYSGSFRQINSIDSIWTGEAGSGLYTWNEYTKYTYPSSFPTVNAEAHTRGSVETVLDLSVSANVEIKQELIGCGFSITLEVGTTCYLRKIDNIDMYIHLY